MLKTNILNRTNPLSSLTPTTEQRSLVGSVATEDITAGSIYVKLIFTKI
jgi:hypothetical protein